MLLRRTQLHYNYYSSKKTSRYNHNQHLHVEPKVLNTISVISAVLESFATVRVYEARETKQRHFMQLYISITNNLFSISLL